MSDKHYNPRLDIAKDNILQMNGLVMLLEERANFLFTRLDEKKQKRLLALTIYVCNELEEVFQTASEELLEIIGSELWDETEKHLDSLTGNGPI